MPDFSSLPEAAVEHIIQIARGRCIAGTSKYAPVCRQWRGASSSCDRAEELQLFMKSCHMSAEELARVTSWIEMYGWSVTTLVMDAMGAQQLQRFWTTAPALSRLRRLEVQRQQDSLFILAPVLAQLTQLQHLDAVVSMAPLASGSSVSGGMALLDNNEGFRPGQFVYRAQADPCPPWDVPDLQQLCPQLTHLHLTFDQDSDTLIMDEQLPRLLPAGLRQLFLGTAPYYEYMWLQSSSLVHLSALQQLTLEDMQMVAGQGPGGVAEDLGSLPQLQQLRLSYTDGCVLEESVMLQLAPRITSLSQFPWSAGLLGVFPHLVHLTQLTLEPEAGGFPQSTAEALASLTKLQKLSLGYTMDDSLVPVLQQVAAMPILRSLAVDSVSENPPSLVASLAQCKQLTSLTVLGVAEAAAVDCVAALQQLTGLRCLAVQAHCVEQEGGAWLVPLTALTCLGVRLRAKVRECGWSLAWGRAQRLLQVVVAWPAALQQVLFSYTGGPDRGGVKPRCWQFNPAGPGDAKVQIGMWFEPEAGTAPGWARPFRPCPHLPGVWELQGEV